MSKKLYKTITFSKELIGPKEAREYLDRMRTNNRNIRERRVRQLLRDMDNNAFQENGETIKFDWNGECIDGNHRLTAISKQKKKWSVLVVRGLNPDVFESIDTGAARTGQDMFRMMGETYYATLAPLVSWQIRHRSGDLYTAVRGKFTPISHNDLKAEFEEHALEYRDAALASNRYKYASKLLTPSVVAFGWYHFWNQDPQKCTEFFEGVNSGENLKKGSAEMALRDTLIYYATSRTVTLEHKGLTAKEKMELMIRAWMNKLAGRRISSRLKFGKTFPNIEKDKYKKAAKRKRLEYEEEEDDA